MMITAASGSLALLGAAYLFQSLGYAPCKMCLWQRWPHAVAVGLGLLALIWARWPVAILGALAALVTGGIGIYHSGVERGWWPGPTSCSGGSDLGGLTGADLLSTDVLDRVIMCDEVSWALIGLSMATWNALFSLGLAGIWVVAALRAARQA